MVIPNYTKYTIGVKSSTTTNSSGDRCKVTNFTAKNTITGEFNSKGECILNPANSNLEWNIGDILMIEVSGTNVGSQQITLTKGGIHTTVSTAAEDAIAVNL